MKSNILKIVKTLFLFSIFFSLFSAQAQAPQRMSYQAIVRNSSNALVANTSVGIRISVLLGSPTGTSVYSETHTTTTNANGLANILIGGGVVISGSFTSIFWSQAVYYIRTETDPTGGTNYTIVGTSQFVSVPYALSSADNRWTATGNNIVNNNNTGVTQITSSVDAPLSISGGSGLYVPFYETGNQRGYFGSYYGAPNDVDFGTTSNNSLGSLHLVTGAVPRLSVNPTGYVGIGTTTPNGKLSIFSNIPEDLLELKSSTTSTQIVMDDSGPDNVFLSTTQGNFDIWTGGNNQRLSVLTNGNTGIGTNAPTTKLEVDGFTKLGSDAPAIKVKKLSGTTGANQGLQITLAHGITPSKIISITALVEFIPNSYVPASYSRSGYEFDIYTDGPNIVLWTSNANSSNILSKPFKILITYEE